MRAEECRAQAEEMKDVERREIVLRIADDYDKLAELEEKTITPFWIKKAQSK
jgi:hypothetical protein